MLSRWATLTFLPTSSSSPVSVIGIVTGHSLIEEPGNIYLAFRFFLAVPARTVRYYHYVTYFMISCVARILVSRTPPLSPDPGTLAPLVLSSRVDSLAIPPGCVCWSLVSNWRYRPRRFVGGFPSLFVSTPLEFSFTLSQVTRVHPTDGFFRLECYDAASVQVLKKLYLAWRRDSTSSCGERAPLFRSSFPFPG